MTRANTPAGPRHVASLDGMRALAAYGVIATHAGFNSGRSLDDGPFAPLLSRLDFGVTLFFLLSGFLLFRPFAVAALAGAPGPAAGAFWWRRFLRIAPAYWLSVSVTLLFLSTRPASPADWRNYLLMTQTYTGHDVDPSLRQMWTLSVEISFYALLPIVSAFVRRLFARNELRGQFALVGTFVVVAFASNVFDHVHSGGASESLLWLPVYLDWFALGMLLAIASCVGVEHARWRRVLGEWAQAAGSCWAGGVLLLWLATLPLAGPRNLLPATTWEWTVKHVLYGAAAFFFLLPVVLDAPRWMQRVLGNPVAAWLGAISYGVYLWHLPLLILIQRWLGWHTFGGHFWALFSLTALAATSVAAGSWHFLERPLLRRFSRPWRRPVRAGDDQQGQGDQAGELRAAALGHGVS
jgi:peptidoglycan/LPS O-acetylase OafA/YrhL